MTSPAASEAPPTEPLFYKVKEAAARLNVSERTVYELLAAGELDRVRIGPPGSKRPAVRVPVASIDAYIARLQQS